MFSEITLRVNKAIIFNSISPHSQHNLFGTQRGSMLKGLVHLPQEHNSDM